MTFNEPHTFAIQGYDVGLEAPGRCSILLRLFCRAGNSATEPYVVAHNVLLSHATVSDIYRKKYKASSIWLYIVPQGIRRLMNYIKQKYGNPVVIITENGNPSRQDGCNVQGYFAWSLLDNWEWAAGYTSRFGLYFIDYNDNLKRYPKNSVDWFKKLLKSV
ncbi:hypothetical protein BHM03_00022567 [Ensete ventricosum]|nr:hypothetical protein BHM03_00022567 [Ensete ventricosum]